MMFGNYVRIFFEIFYFVLLEFILDFIRKENFFFVFSIYFYSLESFVLSIFLQFRKVYRCKDFLRECLLDVKNYKKCVVEMGIFLF